jgi:AraC-like DNA-binding protein
MNKASGTHAQSSAFRALVRPPRHRSSQLCSKRAFSNRATIWIELKIAKRTAEIDTARDDRITLQPGSSGELIGTFLHCVGGYELVSDDPSVRTYVVGPVIAAPANTAFGRLLRAQPEFASQPDHQVQHRNGQNKQKSGVRLTNRQEQTAKENLVAHLTQELSITGIAEACGMSTRRFVRAFRHTTGITPHRWLRAVRIERAKELLRNSSFSLAQIAHDCGFADQSHFTRVFRAGVGITPGAWRREATVADVR